MVEVVLIIRSIRKHKHLNDNAGINAMMIKLNKDDAPTPSYQSAIIYYSYNHV